MSLRIVNWNLEWAKITSQKGRELARRIEIEKAEVVCLTEASLGFLPGGHMIAADADYGYEQKEDRRKVQLWSRNPWVDFDQFGDTKLPTGRFIRGTTETSLGPVTFVGVCVPWKDAHVNTGRRNRSPWEDHVAYLTGLKSVIESVKAGKLIVLGDFNQRIPQGKTTPSTVYELLIAAMADLVLARGGDFRSHDIAIDHAYHSTAMRCEELRLLDNRDGDGKNLSDHVGWSLLLAKRDE